MYLLHFFFFNWQKLCLPLGLSNPPGHPLELDLLSLDPTSPTVKRRSELSNPTALSILCFKTVTPDLNQNNHPLRQNISNFGLNPARSFEIQ